MHLHCCVPAGSVLVGRILVTSTRRGHELQAPLDTGEHLAPGKAPLKQLHLLKGFLQHDPKTTVLHLTAFCCTT